MSDTDFLSGHGWVKDTTTGRWYRALGQLPMKWRTEWTEAPAWITAPWSIWSDPL